MGYVVLADQVSYRDPDDGATRREDQHFLYAGRGEVLPDNVDEKAVKNLLGQFAIAEEGSEDAKLALAGAPRMDSLRRPPSAMLLSNEAESIRAAQSAAQFPGGAGGSSSASELAKLPMESLVTFAKAFGVEIGDDVTKADLAKKLANGGKDHPDATPAEDTAAQREQRDAIQLAARETAEGASTRAAQASAAQAAGDGAGEKKSSRSTGSKSSDDK